MAKKKTVKARKTKKVTRRPGFPTIGQFAGTIPKKGLLDPSLRRDIGNVPGLAKTD